MNSNTIGYVTSNFIGQLYLHVRVNFMFYHVGNCQNIDLKQHTLNLLLKLLFKVNTILELIFSVIEYFIKHLISNTKGLQLWNYFGKYAM